MFDKEQIRTAVRIEEVYETLTGETLQGNGTERRGRCPSPDHTDERPSCDVNVEKKTWIGFAGAAARRVTCSRWLSCAVG